MTKIWRSREQTALAKGLLKPEADLPDLIRRFLLAREILQPEVWDELLRPKLQDLKDPFCLKDMRKAVDRLIQAFKSQEKVCVYADFDLDGTSGLALLLEALEKLGFQNVRGYQPKRLSEGYGFHASAVEELAREGVTLIVTVDVGITAVAAASRARELGVDVILTDHHLPLETKPQVFALINPNQGDCPSELGYLSGAGVAFYLVRALKRGLVDAGLVLEDALPLRGLLDFFTIATLTDMVPLIKDNRALVRQGLSQMGSTSRPGLKVLLTELGLFGKQLSSSDVAIKFAPKLNALSRMETGLRPIDLFRADSMIDAEKMVSEVLENNSARVGFQTAGETLALELLKTWPHDKFVFLVHEEFHRGVVGLIATKIAGITHVPVFIGSKGADGFVVGSGRVPSGLDFNLLEALSAVESCMSRFGGHAAAAGFECAVGSVERVVQGLATFFDEQQNKPAVRVVEYDLDLRIEEVSPGLMKWFENLGPYGQGFSQPTFCLTQVRVKDSKILKGGHRKLWIEATGAHPSLEALYFSPPAHLSDADVAKGAKIDVIGELQWNDFGGNRSLQFLIRELRKSSVLSVSSSVREVQI